MAAEAASVAQAEASKRVSTLVEELLGSWKAGESRRRAELLCTVEKQHSAQLQVLEANTEATHGLIQDADSRWARAFAELEGKMRVRESQYKAACEALFERRLRRFQDENEKRLERTQRTILQHVANESELRHRIEREVAQERLRCIELAKEQIQMVQERASRRANAAREQHMMDLERLGQELAEARAKIVALEELSGETARKATLSRLRDASQLHKLRQDLKHSQRQILASGKDYSGKRERVLELWARLNMNAAEYAPFLLRVFLATEVTAKLETLMDDQLDVLGAKLPIFKLVNARELVKAQLHTMPHVEGHPNIVHGGLEKRDALLADLGRLTAELRARFDSLTKTFPAERVIVDGVDLARILEGEKHSMPDVALASPRSAARCCSVDIALSRPADTLLLDEASADLLGLSSCCTLATLAPGASVDCGSCDGVMHEVEI